MYMYNAKSHNLLEKYEVPTKRRNTGDKQNKLRLYEGPGITFSQNVLDFLHFI